MRPDMIARGLSLIVSGATAQPRRVAGLPQQAAMAEPQLVQRMMLVTALTITGLLLWAWLARLDDIARSGGILVARGNNAVVQHTQGGTLQAIYVQEGQQVTAGQPLLKLDDTDVQADTATIRQRMEFLADQIQRLGYVLGIPQGGIRTSAAAASPSLPSLTENTPINSDTLAASALLLPPPAQLTENATEDDINNLNLFANIEPAAGPFPTTVVPQNDPQTLAMAERYRTLQNGVDLAKDEYKRQLKLRQQGFSTQSRVYAAERDLQSQIQAFSAFQADLAAQYASAASEYTQQDEQLKKLQERQNLTIVKAPTSGIVQSLRLNTPGATVPAGTTLLEIVPANTPLEALLRLSPTHIGTVKVGQKAILRLTAFEASHYGTLEGTVTRISADALADAEGRPTYQVWVTIPQTLVGARGSQPLKPGMVLVAAVVTGQHTVLDYILRPIRNALDDLAPHNS